MNRRGFLIGAIIAPVGAKLLSFLPSIDWKPKSYLYVLPTQKQAIARYNYLGRPRNVKCISTGSAVCGYGADLIIMDEKWRDWQLDSYVRKQHLDDWFNSTIRTRLYPGGKIITRRLT